MRWRGLRCARPNWRQDLTVDATVTIAGFVRVLDGTDGGIHRRVATEGRLVSTDGHPLGEVFGSLMGVRDACVDGALIDISDLSPSHAVAIESLAREIGLTPDGRALRVLPRPRFTRPLVSIVIPAYRADYLRACLDSAFAQTYPSIEVILADDCPTEAVAQVVDVHPRRDEMTVVEGPNHRLPDTADRSGRKTYLRVHEAATGPYVKFLNDDDLLLPTCVERFSAVLDAHPEVTLVTSHRMLIDSAGNRLNDLMTTSRVLPHDAILDGRVAASAMIQTNWNFLGEPTTAMYRAADADLSQPDFLSLAGRLSPGNVDMHLWASLGLRGDIAFLADTLSAMRLHPDQMQNRPVGIERGNLAQENLQDIFTKSGLFLPVQGLTHRPFGDRPWWTDAFIAAVADFRQSAEAGDEPRAKQSLLEARRLAGEDAAQLAHLSEHAESVGLDDLALELAEQALGQPPHHPTAVMRYASIRSRSGDQAAAAQAIEVLRQTCPHSAAVDHFAATLGLVAG